MWICKNCDTKVNGWLEVCWNCQFDRYGNPPNREVERVEFSGSNSEESAPAPRRARPLWFVRGKAFVIDFLIFVSAWAVIDNLIYWPIRQFFIEVLELICFGVYFSLIEGIGASKASLGKRYQKLQVITRYGETPAFSVIVKRTLIVGLLLVFDWSVLLGLIPQPTVAFMLSSTIPVGLVLYNIWLAIFSEDKLMLQDRWTNTCVRPSHSVAQANLEAIAPSDNVPKIFHKPGVAAAIVLATTVIWMTFAALMPAGSGFSGLWEMHGGSEEQVVRAIETSVAEDLGIRSRAEISSVIVWSRDASGEQETQRLLKVSVWIPAISYSDSLFRRLPLVAFRRLNINADVYDAGVFELRFGIEPLRFTKSIRLTIEPTARDSVSDS